MKGDSNSRNKNSKNNPEGFDPKERIDYLVRELQRHQYLYYVKAQPEISDREYDALFDELLELEKKYPQYARPDSPTKRVGSDLDNEFPEVPHPFPMLSLDKVYSSDELAEWMEKTERAAGRPLSFVVEEKVDGSTIVLHYENGVLQRAVTRGNGYVGNDITENVKTIKDIPLRLTEEVSAVFRGEIYIEREDFYKLNAEMDNIYANPRNFAAGSLRRKKSSEVARVPLKSYVYDGYFPVTDVNEHFLVVHRLYELGFRVFNRLGLFSINGLDVDRYGSVLKEHPDWVCGDLRELEEFVELWKKEREKLPYDIDGLVVKVNEIDTRDALGYTAHHPRWALALKFEAPQTVSEIEAIDIQVGRTGRVTPVARIKPVWISGAVVRNVTLHNQDYIDALDVAVGDKVAVSRRGEVIPAVEEVVEKNTQGNKTFKMPDKCPVCGTQLIQDGAHIFCPNRRCPERVFNRIAFFAGKGQMDIENLGPETIKKLIELGLVKDIPDIYLFDPDKLLGVEGFGEKKVKLIKEGIEKSKERPFEVVLASLGLDEVGPKVVELLIEAGFDSVDKIIEAAKKKDPEIFTRIEGIGPKTAQKIIEQFNDPEIIELIDKLRKIGLKFAVEKKEEEEKEKYPQIFEGQTWCVTGSFENFKPRDLAMEEVKKRGGRVSSQVTGKTTHLLVGENPGSKLDKARKLGVKIVTENEFLRLLKSA